MIMKITQVVSMLLLLSGVSYSATLEEFNILMQTNQNIEGLRRNMRDNATGYKTSIATNRLTVAQCADIMRQDATEYKRRIKMMSDFYADPAKNTKLVNGLTAIGAQRSELVGYAVEMKSAADTVLSATLETASDINTVSDNLLSSVPSHDTIF